MNGIRPDAFHPSTSGVCLAISCLLAVAGALGGAGCGHTARITSKSATVSPAATEAAQPGIPFPRQTPFDHERKLRVIYLMAFAQGYSLAESGAPYASPGCLCEAGGDADRYNANIEGFFAGRRAGETAYQAAQARAQNGNPLVEK